MKVLVTGASGFVGSSLVERLRREGHSLRLAARRLPEGFALDSDIAVVGDIGPHTQWTDALVGVEVVVHLAARAHVTRDRADNPLAEFRSVNVEGTRRLVQEAVAQGIRRFVFLSSVKVNGEGARAPFTEEDSPTPEDGYGLSKWEAEKVLHEFGRRSNIEIVIIRAPLVYGPGVKANFLQLLRLVARGIPLPLRAITNRRSFIYVENLSSALTSCVTHPQASGKTFLVSDGVDLSTPELVRLLAENFGRKPRLFSIPLPLLQLAGVLCCKKGAIDRLAGSLSVNTDKIRNEINWAPPYSVTYGLSQTARWFMNEKNS